MHVRARGARGARSAGRGRAVKSPEGPATALAMHVRRWRRRMRCAAGRASAPGPPPTCAAPRHAQEGAVRSPGGPVRWTAEAMPSCSKTAGFAAVMRSALREAMEFRGCPWLPLRRARPRRSRRHMLGEEDGSSHSRTVDCSKPTAPVEPSGDARLEVEALHGGGLEPRRNTARRKSGVSVSKSTRDALHLRRQALVALCRGISAHRPR